MLNISMGLETALRSLLANTAALNTAILMWLMQTMLIIRNR